MSDVVIVGGGISGTAAAFELASEGHRVTLVEARSLAAMASGWTLGGVRQSGRHLAELPLARAAIERWAELEATFEGGVGYRRGGNLRLARDETERDVVRTLVDEQRAAGLELQFLDGNAEVRRLAPALSERVIAASYCPSDGHADPISAVRALGAAAVQAGAEIREGVVAGRMLLNGGRIEGVETDHGPIRCERLVIAAGVQSPALLAPLALPMTVCRVVVLHTASLPPVLAQVLGVANADCAARQELDGALRVTTGVAPFPEPVDASWRGEDFHPSAGELRTLVDRVGALLPALETARVKRVWGGLVDLTPDALPVIDAPEDIPGLVVAAGFSGHGFCLGPITGQIVADLVLDRPPRLPVAPFRLARLRDHAGTREALLLHG